MGGHVNFGYLPLVGRPQADREPGRGGRQRPASRRTSPWSRSTRGRSSTSPRTSTPPGDGGSAGAIWKQLYFRQAFQYLVDQPGIIRDDRQGLRRCPPTGRCPSTPAQSLRLECREAATPIPTACPRPRPCCRSHGWKVVPDGTTTCADPGTARRPVREGHPRGGEARLHAAIREREPVARADDEHRDGRRGPRAGIDVTLSQAPFNTVVGNATACSPGPSCMWELENWGTAGSTNPDHYPTGEQTFSTGAPSNAGSYSDATNDRLTVQTITTDVTLTKWENYLAKQLPVVWQPNTVTEMSEIQDNLRGVHPAEPVVEHQPRELVLREEVIGCRASPVRCRPTTEWRVGDEFGDGPPLVQGPISFEVFRRRPTLPGSLPPSTIGAGGLNCRVRNGNGCCPAAMVTGNRAHLRDSMTRRWSGRPATP